MSSSMSRSMSEVNVGHWEFEEKRKEPAQGLKLLVIICMKPFNPYKRKQTL